MKKFYRPVCLKAIIMLHLILKMKRGGLRILKPSEI